MNLVEMMARFTEMYMLHFEMTSDEATINARHTVRDILSEYETLLQETGLGDVESEEEQSTIDWILEQYEAMGATQEQLVNNRKHLEESEDNVRKALEELS